MYASVKIPPAPCGADDCTGCQSVQVNEPNPVLLSLRRDVDLNGWDEGMLPHHINHATNRPHDFPNATPDQIAHARRVMIRMAHIIPEGAFA
jgi:hypothetical protein